MNEPTHIDEAFAGHDDRRPTEIVVLRISRDARGALEDAIENGYPLMFWGDPAELVEEITIADPVAEGVHKQIAAAIAESRSEEE